MNTKLLRQKVLDLAIHGRLVPQNPEHEPASKLLERIRGESLPLATAGKPSSAAPSAGSNAARNARSNPISEDEIPFEIPESWCWCRLGELFEVNPKVNGNDNEYASFIPMEKIEPRQKNIFSFEEGLWKTIKKNHTVFQDGDVCFAKISPCFENGKCFIATGLKNGIGAGTTELIVLRNSILNRKYIFYFLGSEGFVKDCCATFNGVVGQQRINTTFIKNYPFPLPPLEEQKLIVEEIERIFALIDTVEQNKTDLETVIKQTKSKILDLAIHGKLVPQDKADEPASKMLEKLRAEKEEKIAKGQLKRDKNDSYIYKSTDEKWLERKADGSEEEIEVPFEIPESWSWCKIKNIALDMADGPFGSNLKTEHYTTEQEARLIQLSNIGEEGWREDNTKYTTFEHAKTYISRSIVEPGNIVIAKMMPAGRAIICPDHEKMFVLSSDAVRLVPSELLCVEYLLKAINSPTFRESVTDKVQGSTRMRTSISKLKECFIPIPPLEEQKRIISKIKSIGNDIKVILKNIEG